MSSPRGYSFNHVRDFLFFFRFGWVTSSQEARMQHSDYWRGFRKHLGLRVKSWWPPICFSVGVICRHLIGFCVRRKLTPDWKPRMYIPESEMRGWVVGREAKWTVCWCLRFHTVTQDFVCVTYAGFHTVVPAAPVSLESRSLLRTVELFKLIREKKQKTRSKSKRQGTIWCINLQCSWNYAPNRRRSFNNFRDFSDFKIVFLNNLDRNGFRKSPISSHEGLPS